LEITPNLGYVAAKDITDYLTEKLESNPLHICICLDIFPTGVLSYYARNLVNKNYIGILFGTTPPLVKPRYAQKKCLGTNPLAIAIPGKAGQFFVCDITTAQSSFGELLLAKYRPLLFDLDKYININNDTPNSLEELFDMGNFTGAIAQKFEDKYAYRQFSLLIAIELLTVLLANRPSSVGTLIIIGIQKNAFQSSTSQNGIESFLGYLQTILEPFEIPGIHAERLYQKNKDIGILKIADSLWFEIADR